MDYLGSVYSPEHVRAIPNLRFLEFIAHGRGVKSERPLIAKREFDQKKADASHALDVKKKAKATDAPEADGFDASVKEHPDVVTVKIL